MVAQMRRRGLSLRQRIWGFVEGVARCLRMVLELDFFNALDHMLSAFCVQPPQQYTSLRAEHGQEFDIVVRHKTETSELTPVECTKKWYCSRFDVCSECSKTRALRAPVAVSDDRVALFRW